MKKILINNQSHQRIAVWISCFNQLSRFIVFICLEKVRDLRLDQYLSINTSEDNISFEQIMEETQKKERSKDHQAWLYQQQALTHSVSYLKRLNEKLYHLLFQSIGYWKCNRTSITSSIH